MPTNHLAAHAGLLLAIAIPRAGAAQAPALQLDHVWIVVNAGAPERSALERAGLHVSPTVNRHDGQGTASVMAELTGGFIELLWPDSSVTVAPGSATAFAKFRARQAWRSTGWSPFGIGLRRTTSAPDSLPFATWPIHADWMRPGESLDMITARADTVSPSVWVVPRSMAIGENSPSGQPQDRLNGTSRITALHLTVPASAPNVDAITLLTTYGIASVDRGTAWLLEITIDNARRGMRRDLRPALPVVVRY